MKNIFSLILNLFAPWARAKLKVSEQQLGRSYSDLAKLISKELPVKSTGESSIKFRVKGDFFAHPESTLVVLGVKANPAHFANIGFDFTIENLGHGEVLFIAEERVILGYFEVKAASLALNQRLYQIIRFLSEKKQN